MGARAGRQKTKESALGGGCQVADARVVAALVDEELHDRRRIGAQPREDGVEAEDDARLAFLLPAHRERERKMGTIVLIFLFLAPVEMTGKWGTSPFIVPI